MMGLSGSFVYLYFAISLVIFAFRYGGAVFDTENLYIVITIGYIC